MHFERDKYRNPLPPVGYVQTCEPRLVQKKADYEDDPMYILMQELLDAKGYDVPDITIYEEFELNPSSDDEIQEVPFVPIPKMVDTVDITAENDELNIDPPINIKKERVTPEPPVVTKDSVQTAASESETRKHKKKYKKNRSHPIRKKLKHRYKSYSSDSNSTSESHFDDWDSRKLIVWDSSDESRSPTRKKEDYVNERKSRSKSHQRKKKNYGSDSDSHSRKRSSSRKRRYRKRSSSSRSRSRNRHRRKKDCSSGSDDDRHYKKRENHSYKKLHAKDERQFDFQEDATDNNSYKDSKHLASSSFSKGHQAVPEAVSQDLKFEPNYHLYGDYYCKVCNVSANNELTYESHLKGKKHIKNVEKQEKEAQREALLAKHPHPIKAEEKAKEEPMIPPNPLLRQATSKYPEPPVGYYRQKMNVPSVIQKFLDNDTKFPCPGLHKVKEIRGPTETVYYCGICDCNCSYNSIMQHLSGFKHQLNSLKYYRNELYEKWSYKPKYVIQDKVIKILYNEEKNFGRGLVQVEKDVKVAGAQNVDTARADPDPVSRVYSQPSTSYQHPGKDFLEFYKFNSMPDPTKSGFYCKLCDSHSNSEAMWNAHIIGKRHVANLKKNPGIAPSKSKYVRAERDVQPILFTIIEKENEDNLPIIGLNQIREIRKPDINGLLFNCFLCGACISASEIVNHILSSKHREKYLNSIKHPDLEALKDIQVSEFFKSSILEDISKKVQQEEGMGTPDVVFAKR